MTLRGESTITLELRDPSWAAFVDSFPDASPFHHPVWTGLVADCYRLRGFAVALRDERGAIIAGAPFVAVDRGRCWISTAFTDYCEPLGEESVRHRLVAALEEERKLQGVRSIEIRALVDGPAQSTVVGFRHRLALDAPPDEIRARFNSQVQRGIRKALGERIQVRLGSSRGDLESFYSLHLETRRRLGVPIQPRAFFDALWERLLDPGLGKIAVAELDRQPVAAAVFLGWGDTLVYKFGASSRSAWSHRPNHALFWSAILWACENGFSALDFGRTDLGNEGLRAFKAGWGTVESELVYSTLGKPRSVRGNGNASRVLGAVIRHSPEVVCRQIGEHLYRYAA